VPSPAAAFYFDLASPLAYLAAERILHLLPAPAEWRPVLEGDLGGESSRPGREELTEMLSVRAIELGLQPLRLPERFPFDSTLAMRAATYAKSIGRTVPFAQAAFRQAFAGGHSLEDEDYVLIAGAACEMHPAALLKGAGMRSVRERLALTGREAADAGVEMVPAITVGPVVFQGQDAPERARAHMLAVRQPGGSPGPR